MSHNVTISGVKVNDLEILRQAAQEFTNEGVRMTFQENAELRGYSYHNEKTDVVLKMEDYRYDVGFVKQEDGTYVPRFEDMAMSDFGRSLGTEADAESVEGERFGLPGYNPSRCIGKLIQKVNVITAENEAARNGKTTRRVEDKDKGIIYVEVE